MNYFNLFLLRTFTYLYLLTIYILGVAIESTSPSTSWKSNGFQAPTEDRYAALKDLDCLMKSQVQQDISPQLDNSNSSAWSKLKLFFF